MTLGCLLKRAVFSTLGAMEGFAADQIHANVGPVLPSRVWGWGRGKPVTDTNVLVVKQDP